MRHTVTSTVHAIRAMGLACSWSAAFKEYRVTLRGVSRSRAEAVAYFTNDPDDAIATAYIMLRQTSCTTDLNLSNAAE